MQCSTRNNHSEFSQSPRDYDSSNRYSSVYNVDTGVEEMRPVKRVEWADLNNKLPEYFNDETQFVNNKRSDPFQAWDNKNADDIYTFAEIYSTDGYQSDPITYVTKDDYIRKQKNKYSKKHSKSRLINNNSRRHR